MPINTTASHIAARGPAAPPTVSMSVPPNAIARIPADPVATLDRPMYLPLDAFGMMSVMSAQSTARNMPAETPYRTAPIRATMKFGAIATSASPAAPTPQLA
jgi:hypothetical protein